MEQDGLQSGQRRGVVRYGVIAMLFVLSTINYADRATMSIAGGPMQADLGISTIQMGYIFSAFGWAYVFSQIPGGVLIDRFGTKIVYLGSIILWSLFTLAQGFVVGVTAYTAMIIFFLLRLMLGVAEAPAFPANARIVATWFPMSERGTATAIFNSAQYFALVAFAPAMAWVTQTFGWHYVFIFMGSVGILVGLLFAATVYPPLQHPWLGKNELDHMRSGGALIDEPSGSSNVSTQGFKWSTIRQLFGHRLLLSAYAGQYFINALTYFFSTWFPLYLIKEHGMSVLQAGFASVLPAAFGWVGGILGGVWTDWLLRRGASLTLARKLPIAAGAILSSVIFLCNFTSSEALVMIFITLEVAWGIWTSG